MSKNNVMIGKVSAIDENGMGLIPYHNSHIGVRGVIIDEVVEVEVGKKINNGYAGKLIRIVSASSDRMKSQCPYSDSCGSCHLLHISYKKQLEMKQTMIKEALKKENLRLKVQECVGMEHPYSYRNKIIISFGKKKKEVVAGFYEEYTHKIIPIQHCLLHEDVTNELIEDLKEIVKKSKIEIYDEDRGYGFLRHILIRRSMIKNETMVVIVGAEKVFKAKNNFLRLLKEKHPEITTVIFNYNPRKTSVVLGNVETVIYGKGFIEDILCGKYFRISSKSFYQINHEQCEKLYEKAISLLQFNGNETLIDAYCGIGTIGMIASDKVAKVYSVEVNQNAVKDAIVNAKRNKITNVRLFCEDAGTFMVNLAKQKEKIDAVILDPAREGSDERFLSSLVKLSPKQVVYISCNPLTQIRDLKYLIRNGYVAREIFLYDMFPHTFHVESVVLLIKVHN